LIRIKEDDGARMKVTELFYGLCRYYSSLGLTEDISWSSWGQRTVSYFDQLGRMLGYTVNTEDTLISDEEWKCPPKLKGKRIDMTWTHPKTRLYILALEHQGSNNPTKIQLDIEKLAQIGTLKSTLKILIVYGQDTKQVQTWVKQIISKTAGHKGSFLLINIPNPNSFQKTKPFKELHARLINEQGDLIGAGTAEARMESTTGRFFSNPKWYSSRK